jgi:hypothetical protein
MSGERDKLDSYGARVPVRDVRTYYKVRIKGHGGGCIFESEDEARAEVKTLRDEVDEEVEVVSVQMDAQAFERLSEFDGDYA